MRDIAERLYNLYSGLKRAHGTFEVSGNLSTKGKVQGKALTLHEEVTIDLWLKHLRGERSLGIVPIMDDNCCLFGAIDIDEYDLNLDELEAKIYKAKLPLILVKSKSGGAHCYLFLKDPIPAAEIRELLELWAIRLGHKGVEIFPKQDSLSGENDVGNWLNMPYFDAEVPLSYGYYAGEALGYRQFLDLAESKRQTARELMALSPISSKEVLEEGPPCLNIIVQDGVGEGQRNNVLFNLGVYARLRYPSDWENKLDEFNTKLIAPPLGYKEVGALVKSLKKKDYHYRCSDVPLCTYCSKNVCSKRKYGIGSGESLGVTIESLTKVCANPPQWIAQVNGARIELSTDELKSQAKFQLKCIEALNYYPANLKPDAWKKLVNKLLQEVREVEPPPDADADGQLLFYLEKFCTGKAQAMDKGELILGKPWTDQGRTYFRSTDLYEFLEKHRFREYRNITQLWQALRRLNSIDMKHDQKHINGKCVQCWSVSQFEEQTEELPPRRLDTGEGEF